MADANDVKFAQRLSRIDRRHRKLSRGYVRLKEVDGLLIPVPDRRARRSLPMPGLLLAGAAFVAFKGFLLAYHGPATYAERVGLLADGTTVERFGAWLMTADPATMWVARQFAIIPGLW